ncbi:MAG: NAD-dependent deacylase [Asgard group archaeon]|nr:NAD-dependent deacylase [Asgard group archaeon]
MAEEITSAFEIANNLLKKGKLNAYVLTGAGTSRASNIPTFRGEDGLWEKYNFEEVATLRAWLKNPVKIWTVYAEGIQLILDSEPNPAHKAIVELEKKNFCQYIITQNADGLHQKAGSKNVLEIHGNLTRVRCTKCNKKQTYTEPPTEIPPICQCGSMYRPDVVLFNEQLPSNLISKSFEIARKVDLAIVVGTSAEVVPAATLPYISKENGAKVLVFNKEETDHSRIADVFIKGKCEETLPAFVELLSKN